MRGVPEKKSGRGVGVYASTIFLSAFLLFLVQPMLGKVILPWFGGVAGVWAVALLFFQGTLLAGYAYSYLLVRYLPPKAQAAVHIVLLAASLPLMPLAPARAGRMADPAFEILAVLALGAGLPYLMLSTTGPLIQAWYARAERAAFPYRLYALSNAGSLAALVAYPFAVEPFFTTRQQLSVWSWMYGAFACLCVCAAVRARAGGETAAAARAAAPRRSDYVWWMALAACGSALLVATTNHLTQNIAPMPLLWILPLAAYLLSFILCFEGRGFYRPGWVRWLLPPVLGAMLYGYLQPHSVGGVGPQIALYTAGLWLACMFCHGELARRKPAPQHLASFYLALAGGGAAGSLAVALVAPRISSWPVEFPEALLVCGILATLALYGRGKSVRAARFVLVTALVLLISGLPNLHGGNVILLARSFYGSLWLAVDHREDPMVARRVLLHGRIRHGDQYLAPELSGLPTTYYSLHSGVAVLLAHEHPPWQVGIVGLGTGTVAAYGRPGDEFRFYEIDPLVAQLAASEFTYMRNSRAKVDVIIGDGRLELAREPAKRFDVLLIDAFSGDSVPAHLLTREAFELYFNKLKPEGVLAVHITNRYVNLVPVLAKAAEALGAGAVLAERPANDATGAYASTWVIMSAARDAFAQVQPRVAVPLPAPPPGFRLWTDDYSNLLGVLR